MARRRVASSLEERPLAPSQPDKGFRQIGTRVPSPLEPDPINPLFQQRHRMPLAITSGDRFFFMA